VTIGFAFLVLVLWLGLVGLFGAATGWRLPRSCPRITSIDVPAADRTAPVPVSVDKIRERLALEHRGKQWCHERPTSWGELKTWQGGRR
jgi:hypothetical protein